MPEDVVQSGAGEVARRRSVVELLQQWEGAGKTVPYVPPQGGQEGEGRRELEIRSEQKVDLPSFEP